MADKTYGFTDERELTNAIKNVGFTFMRNEFGSRNKMVSVLYAGDSIDPADRQFCYTLRGMNTYSLVKHIEAILKSIVAMEEKDKEKYKALLPVYNAIVNHSK